MASALLSGPEQLCNAPFLVKVARVDVDATPYVLTHGESRTPDVYFAQCNEEGAASSAIAITAPGATTLSIDSLVNTLAEANVYMIWFGQPGTGGLTAP